MVDPGHYGTMVVAKVGVRWRVVGKSKAKMALNGRTPTAECEELSKEAETHGLVGLVQGPGP